MKPNKRIRILVTVPHLNRTASPYREMMAIAKHIRKEEFDLTICTLRDKGHEETGPRLASFGVPWFLSVFRPRNRRASEIAGSCLAQREIERHGPFDIQHSLDFTSSPAEAMGARVRATRYIYNQRNMNENGHPMALRMKFRLSNRIVSIADHITEFLQKEGAKARKIVKIPNGIDLDDTDRELAAAGNCERQDRILVLGQIEPRKRHQDIIKAMPALIQKHPNLQLAIAGNVYHQEYLNGLKQLVHELELAGKVEFLGGRDDVPALLQQSRALVLCSESEGLPWVILEAMAARLPFVGSNIGAHREVVRQERTGMLAPLGEPAGFAAALDRILSNPEFAARLTAEARARVESDFSAARMVRQTEEMYRGMMARKTQTQPANATLATRGAE